jgi:YD repeat-containing protein
MTWLRAHWRWVAAGGAALLLAGIALYARCRPAPVRVEERAVTDGKRDGSWGSTSTMARTVTRTTGRVVRERYDASGRVTARTVVEPGTTQATTQSQAQAGGQTHETTHTVTERVEVPVALRPRWRISAGAEWTARDLAPRPTLAAEVEYRAVDLGPVSLRPYVGATLDRGNRVDARAGARVVLEIP